MHIQAQSLQRIVHFLPAPFFKEDWDTNFISTAVLEAKELSLGPVALIYYWGRT